MAIKRMLVQCLFELHEVANDFFSINLLKSKHPQNVVILRSGGLMNWTIPYDGSVESLCEEIRKMQESSSHIESVSKNLGLIFIEELCPPYDVLRQHVIDYGQWKLFSVLESRDE